MKLAGLTAAIVAAAAATGAQAQETTPPDAAIPTAAAEPTGTDGEGVIKYPPEFFASAQPQSAFDMIVRVPGFSFDGGDNVRGFGGAAGNVLIDGQRPASKRDSLEAVLRRIPASTVERIELIRGGAPGIDMQGHTVVVNVVRKTTASSQALFAVASAFHQDGRETPAMRIEGSRRWDGMFVEGSLLLYTFIDDGAGEGPRIVRDGLGNVIERAHADETAGGHGVETKASFESPLFGGKMRLNGSLRIERYDWELIDDTYFPAPFRFQVEDNFDELYQTEFGLQWEKQLGPRTTIELLAIQQLRDTDFTSMYVDPSNDIVFGQTSFSGESIVRGKGRFRWSDALTFEGGGEIAYNFLDRSTTYVENGVVIPLPAANVLVEEERAEVFLQGTWRVTPQLTVEGGSKVEFSRLSQSGDTDLEKEFVYPKPRLFVTWAPDADNQLRFRVEREVGQLNFGDFVSSATLSTGFVTAGNADLEPYKNWTFEAAYERRFWGKGAIVLTGRYQMIEDVVDRIPVVDPSTCPLVGGVPDVTSPLCTVFSGVGNIDEGRNLEFAVNLTLPLEKAGLKGGELRFNGTWRESEVEDPTTGEDRRISGQQPFSGQINFTNDVPRFRLTWGADAFLEWEETYYFVDQIETVGLETWYRLWVDWKIKPNLQLRVEAQNLADRALIRDREVYGGRRDLFPVAFREHKELAFPAFLYVRIRRTWG